MSNRQLGWDQQQVRDQLSPRELAEADKQAATEDEGEQPQQPKGYVPDSAQRSRGNDNKRDK